MWLLFVVQITGFWAIPHLYKLLYFMHFLGYCLFL